jgi:hypothetical protein
MITIRSIVTMCAAMSLAASVASAQGKAAAPAKPQPKLPAVVETTFKTTYPNAIVKNVIHETEDGQEQYEIESTNSGRGLDVSYKPDGTLLVVEEQVAQADVPAAVTAAIVKRYPKAKLTSFERATEKAKVSYEIAVTGAPVKTVQLAADGTWISPKVGKS